MTLISSTAAVLQARNALWRNHIAGNSSNDDVTDGLIED
jgi:hypothetical protein